MNAWPTCTKCNRGALVHTIKGSRLLCDESTESSFTAADVADVRLAIGRKVPATLRRQANADGWTRTPA